MGKVDYRGYRDLKAYRLAYQLALEIHEISKAFPREEKYSLTDQIRRSSRSIPANVAEAWKKRRYKKMFVSKIIDAAGEAGETEVWLDFAKDLGYLDEDRHRNLMERYDEINRILSGIIEKADKFSLVGCRNPGPLGQVRIRAALPLGLFLKSRWRGHESGIKPGSLAPDSPIQAISLQS